MNKNIENITNTHNKNAHDTNEGLITHIWGPSLWNTMHNVSFNYPPYPSDKEKQKYKLFYTSLSYVIPCEVCRLSYAKFIKTGDFELNDNVLESRDTLTKWVYDLHNKVNEKTGALYNLSYDDICDKYNSYIIKCSISNVQKSLPYKNYYNVEARYLSYNDAKLFNSYAKLRGVDDFTNVIKKLKDVNKNSDEWIERNKRCWKIIKHMKLNCIQSIETNGEFIDLPSVEELHLMKLLSTQITSYKLKDIINKLNIQYGSGTNTLLCNTSFMKSNKKNKSIHKSTRRLKNKSIRANVRRI